MSFLSNLFGQNTIKEVKILSAEDFKADITKKKVQLLDVRTPAEYRNGYIKGAKNLDYFNQGFFKMTAEKLDRNQPIYIYCQSGNRSQKAAKVLVSLGFTEIYDLRGGYMHWSTV